MKEDTILNRILNVYYQSIRSVDNVDEEAEKNEPESINKSPIYIYSHPEIDGNYLLFFNEIYTTFTRKWIKKILKKIAWPILKRQIYFNATIKQVLYELIQRNEELVGNNKKNNEYFSYIEQKLEQLSKVEIRIENLTRIEQQLLERISIITDEIEHIPQLKHEIEQISTRLEADNSLTIKNRSVEESKIESGLWFNEPIIISHDDDRSHWVGTTERILEKNFILLSLARLYESSQIQVLDVGSSESLLAYELASLNYAVTAVDIRPIALSHPNLKFVKSDICDPVLPTASFDCVIALSTLEHIGLGWYGDKVGAGLDRKAVEQIHSLLKPEGNFILTVPYGKRALTPVHRIYDRESLQELIQNFSIVRSVYGIHLDDFTYNVTDNEIEASLKEHNSTNYLPGAVAMLVCKKI